MACMFQRKWTKLWSACTDYELHNYTEINISNIYTNNMIELRQNKISAYTEQAFQIKYKQINAINYTFNSSRKVQRSLKNPSLHSMDSIWLKCQHLTKSIKIFITIAYICILQKYFAYQQRIILKNTYRLFSNDCSIKTKKKLKRDKNIKIDW